MTIRELLTAISPAPVSDAFIKSIGTEVGVDMDSDVSKVGIEPVDRARARLYLFLATVPNISEGGVSITFTADDKKVFLNLARKYATRAGETGLVPGVAYGYKGENL